jgi:succinate dehydrogenase / fumarate reductase cytochrome b subunit
MARTQRPLSPHLGIYSWQVSNSLSILHRATGVLLSLAAIVLVGWLVTLAAGYEAYTRFMAWLSNPLGILFLFGVTFSFLYHLCNGIRHLFWDAGMGFEKERARQTGLVVVAVSTVMTLAIWVAAFAGGEG